MKSTRRGFEQFSRAWQAWRQREGNAPLPAFVSSLFLIMGRVASPALGFLSWLLAARLYAPAEVGLASGAVAAMMLCVQIGLLGIGAAVITIYPRFQQPPTALFNTAISLVAVTAFTTAGAFLALAGVMFHELSIIAAVPIYAVMFLGMGVLGTIKVLLDHFSIATGAATSLSILTAWVAADAAACFVGAWQLRQSVAVTRYRYQPRIERPIARQLFGIGLPNYLLTLTERAPAQIMPIVVVELLSPEANAAWYAAWTMAWVIFIIPISISQTLFAEAARHPSELKREVMRSLKSSLALSALAAAGILLIANLTLSLLGSSYVADGATPLRILALGVLPVTFIQIYYAICRATGCLREATLTGLANGLMSISAAAAASVVFGLPGMAVAWLGVQIGVGVWAAWRLHALIRSHLRSTSFHSNSSAVGAASGSQVT
jgi:O-antigen/teichoic acid export membrane protein